MELRTDRYALFVDNDTVPPMFGIECRDGTRIHRLSTDSMEVACLIDTCNRCDLSEEHIWDVVEDFRHS